MNAETLMAYQLVMSRALARCAAMQPDPQAFLDEQRDAILVDAAEIRDLIARTAEREKLAAELETLFREAAV